GLFTNLAVYQRWSMEFLSPRFTHLGPWVIVTPVIGGIIIGIMAKYGTEKIKGHGIPEAMEAVLINRSRIQPRVAILKPISAAIAIGTGGPFGAEGPIIQTGGAFGSLVGQIVHTTAAERKVLLASGAAAGMSATFNTPIAGVILAIELLLFEFKSRSFIPLVIASTLATAIHMRLLGAGPMFAVAAVDFGIPRALPFYLLLGVICGFAAFFFCKSLYWVEDQFEKLPVDPLWWPAIGAFALVAMGAVFGAASRATFTFIIFAFEITRDYNSVLPLMLVSVIADGVAMLLMPTSSIMTEKLARRGLRIHQDYETDVLRQVAVAET